MRGRFGLVTVLSVLVAAVVLPVATSSPAAAQASGASAVLRNAAGATVGTVAFSQAGRRVVVRIEANNLSPGLHGFHIHAVGTCTAPAFTSAGGHWDPAAGGHGAHAGDLPFLLADRAGRAHASYVTGRFAVAQLFDADGSAVIVHAGRDNLANIPDRYSSSDPAAPPTGPDAATLATGDAGARTACGIVEPTLARSGGYSLVGGDGGVFTFGNASFEGSLGGRRPGAGIVDAAPTASGNGYVLAGRDGSAFTFGDAGSSHSAGDPPATDIVGVAAPPAGAAAVVRNVAGDVLGTVTFTQDGGAVRVRAHAAGLTPGFHGFHIHAVGTCAAPDFTSAGGHWNLTGASHGAHAGDLPVLLAAADGATGQSAEIDGFSVAQLFDADGSAVIVHAGRDNLANIPDRYSSSDPAAPATGPDAATLATGDAGARAGCGVVRSVPQGHWLAQAGGAVHAFGGVRDHGSLRGARLSAPIADIEVTPTGLGYWLLGEDGGVFAFGDAAFRGSLGARRPSARIVGMAATPTGLGYWLLGEDGGVFAFGDAPFLGSMGGRRLAARVVGITASTSGQGYALAGADGGVFAFGDAPFLGSMGGRRLAAPVVGLFCDLGG